MTWDEIRSLEVIVHDLKESLAHDILTDDEREQKEIELQWFDDELEQVYNERM